MGSRLNPLNFVLDTLNGSVRSDLGSRRLLFYQSTNIEVNPDEKFVEFVDEDSPLTRFDPIEVKPFRFDKPVLCLPVAPVNEYNESNLGRVAVTSENEAGNSTYWANVRTLSRNSLSSFEGIRSQSSVLVIVFGLDIRTFNQRYLRMDDSDDGARRQLAMRTTAFNVLDYLEQRSLMYFRRARRLRQQIAISDDWSSPVAFRRFTVVISA